MPNRWHERQVTKALAMPAFHHTCLLTPYETFMADSPEKLPNLEG